MGNFSCCIKGFEANHKADKKISDLLDDNKVKNFIYF